MLATSSSKEQVIVAGRVDGTGTESVVSGEGFSIATSGTGSWTIQFHRAYDALVAVTATTQTADSCMVVSTITHVDGTIGPSIIFTAFDATDGTTGKDVDFSFITIWETDT
jgi:hypothetical protein|tara:strand:+ start:2777 stop:3109 length:333 start_codon:yes stop_codon:yes gene_type:complete